MTKRMTSRDWEILSAYLDNELSPRDRIRIERRLPSDAELRQALEGLRRTRIVLRSQPPMRAPRNFTLSPQAAGVAVRRKAGGSFMALRFASLIASLLFVFVVVSDLVVNNTGRLAMQPAPEPFLAEQQAVEMEGMAEVTQAAGEEEAPAAAMAIPESAEKAVEPVPAAPQPTMMLPLIERGAYPPPQAALGAGAYPPPLGTLEAEDAFALQTPPTASVEPEEPSTQPEIAMPDVRQENQAVEAAAEPQTARLPLNFWRIAEVTLALVAILSAVGTLLLGRARRARDG